MMSVRLSYDLAAPEPRFVVMLAASEASARSFSACQGQQVNLRLPAASLLPVVPTGDWPAEQVSKAWPATTKMHDEDARARDARLQSGKLRRAPRAGAEGIT